MPDVTALDLYRCMLRIRLFEEEVVKRFRKGELPGFVHLSIGQEAAATGVCLSLERDDVIATTHRGHGHVIAKGADLRALAAELYGSPEGCCRGVGGSMHLVDLAQGVLSAGAIVGGTIPLAVGAGFTMKQKGLPRVAVSFLGEGAVNQGVFHECLNIASLWKLPVIFVVENNGYAEMTPTAVHTAVVHMSEHGRPYDMHAVTIDGNDVEQVQSAAREAIAKARNGEGPSLVECMTYRVRGHFEGDQQKYKPRDESQQWNERDPISTFRGKLLSRGTASQEQLDDLTAAATAELDAAFAGLSSETALTRADLEAMTYTDPPAEAHA